MSDKLGVFLRCCIRHFPVYVTKKFELLKWKCRENTGKEYVNSHLSSQRQVNQRKKLQDSVDYEINEVDPIFRVGDWDQVVIFHVQRMSCTLGARDFSSAVSGFCRRQVPPHARKTSGTQGRCLDMCTKNKYSVTSDKKF